MKVPAMERGRMQVLYNYLPGAVFSLGDNAGIARSVFVSLEEEDQIDPNYALSLVKKRIEAWLGHEIGGLKFPPLSEENFVIGRPNRVSWDFFPLTFYCAKCGAVQTYMDAQHAIDEFGKDCRKCGPDGRMRQTNMILVHDCGMLDQINVPQSCPRCKQSDQLMMDTKGRRRFKDVDWRCMRCSIPIPSLLTKLCPICAGRPKKEGESNIMKTAVHTANSNFYVHSVTFVNLRKAVPGRVLDAERLHLGLLAWNLSKLDQGIDLGVLLAAQGVDEVALTAEQEKTLATVPAELQHQVREGWLAQAKKAAVEKAPEMASAISDVSGLVTSVGGCVDAKAANHELVEYVAGRLEHGDELSLEAMMKDAQGFGWKSIADGIKAAGERAKAYGFSDVRLLQKFPLATVAYGFTRVTSESSASLRSFRKNRGESRNPMYAVAADTEGVLFQLDPRRVVRWLAARGVPGLPAKSHWDDVRYLRAWFLCRVNPPGVFGVAAGQPGTVDYELPRLLHTLSHVLMKAATMHSGLDASSLKEYMFFRNLSFVVYHNAQAERSLGAMYSLVQQGLDAWLESAMDSLDCIFDPVCSAQHESNCHSCVHSAETSCERFNHLLGRDSLWDMGGKVGFWGTAWNSQA